MGDSEVFICEMKQEQALMVMHCFLVKIMLEPGGVCSACGQGKSGSMRQPCVYLIEFSLEIHSEVSKDDLLCPRQNLSVQDARAPARVASWMMVTMTDLNFRKITPATDNKHGN